MAYKYQIGDRVAYRYRLTGTFERDCVVVGTPDNAPIGYCNKGSVQIMVRQSWSNKKAIYFPIFSYRQVNSNRRQMLPMSEVDAVEAAERHAAEEKAEAYRQARIARLAEEDAAELANAGALLDDILAASNLKMGMTEREKAIRAIRNSPYVAVYTRDRRSHGDRSV